MTATPHVLGDGRVTVHHGDALAFLREMPAGSVDAIVTDPPYSLRFMGRAWDSHESPAEFGQWCQEWAAECLRVTKPGGYLASFGGTRTYHRLACGVEDAGWYITDAIGAGLYAWTHGQGFPKGKTQLKPAWEPITIGRKAAARVQPLGIDACRVGDDTSRGDRYNGKPAGGSWWIGEQLGPSNNAWDVTPGRWPSNLVLAHHPKCVEVGTREVRTKGGGGGVRGFQTDYVGGASKDAGLAPMSYGSRETMPAFDCHPDCHVRQLDEQSGDRRSSGVYDGNGSRRGGDHSTDFGGGHRPAAMYGDSGGASRFFPTFRYQAKAPRSERPQVDGRGHPTVKPLGLMAWLARLLVAPGGTVLDPFAGSGSTLQAAHGEGMTAVGVEADEYSVALIRQRFADAAARTAPVEPDLFTTSAS